MTFVAVDPILRFGDKVLIGDGCWEWQGAAASDYARIRVGDDSRSIGAHVFIYELLVGPIPDGYEIDHLCRNTKCCRPSHLEAVTQAENLRRRLVTPPRLICIAGHPYDDSNTYVQPTTGKRQCRACKNRRQSEYQQRKAAAA